MRTGISLRAKAIAVLANIILVILCVNPVPQIEAAVAWTKHTGEVTLDSALYVVDSWVVSDGFDYEMWYTHGKTSLSLADIGTCITSILTGDIINDFIDLDFETLLTEHLSELDIETLWDTLNNTSTVIGYAKSTDGTDWDVEDSEVFAATGDGWDSVGTPCVVKTTGGYEMWYTHTKLNLTKTEIETAITDMAYPEKRVDTVISLMESVYAAIGYATSTDGQDWTIVNEDVLPTGGSSLWESVGDPSVIRTGDSYQMWYTYGETSLTREDMEAMMTDILNHDFDSDNFWDALNRVSSTIGYATSEDGQNWTVESTSGLSTPGGGIWDSVAGASVVKTAGGYEMWYTNWVTDLDMTGFYGLIEEVKLLKPDIIGLWDIFQTGDMDLMISELIRFLDGDSETDPVIEPLKPYLANTATRIGYATSADGITWEIEDEAALTGNTGYIWSSNAAPCVVFNDGLYEIWFTQGIDELTAQNVLEVILGDILPIGYASFSASVEIELAEGWNLIGLPLDPTSSATVDVLADILDNVVIVWANDATTGNWSSFYYNPLTSKWTGTLTEMAVGKGYWIELTAATTLDIFGVIPALPFSINLVEGWNLISIPIIPTGSSATVDVLADILDNVVIVWANDATTGNWSSFYYNPLTSKWTGTLTEMAVGKGYWIEMTSTDTLVIN
ncbi:MAG: hypothetical protein PHE15_03030 [Dehalococcoidales bacterium]|nr:hypothetical protein [Dehalococcoidales bacterium]